MNYKMQTSQTIFSVKTRNNTTWDWMEEEGCLQEQLERSFRLFIEELKQKKIKYSDFRSILTSNQNKDFFIIFDNELISEDKTGYGTQTFNDFKEVLRKENIKLRSSICYGDLIDDTNITIDSLSRNHGLKLDERKYKLAGYSVIGLSNVSKERVKKLKKGLKKIDYFVYASEVISKSDTKIFMYLPSCGVYIEDTTIVPRHTDDCHDIENITNDGDIYDTYISGYSGDIKSINSFTLSTFGERDFLSFVDPSVDKREGRFSIAVTDSKWDYLLKKAGTREGFFSDKKILVNWAQSILFSTTWFEYRYVPEFNHYRFHFTQFYNGHKYKVVLKTKNHSEFEIVTAY